MKVEDKPRYFLYIDNKLFGTTNNLEVVKLTIALNPSVKIIDTWNIPEEDKEI